MGDNLNQYSVTVLSGADVKLDAQITAPSLLTVLDGIRLNVGMIPDATELHIIPKDNK